MSDTDKTLHRDAAQAHRLDCHILLAEDDRDHQQLYSTFFRRAGSRITVVENGQLAVEVVRAAGDGKVPFDLILMDMKMPVLDGYGATRQLRQAGFAGPIIALTAYAITDDREKCLAAGCDEYASKPVQCEDLIALVARYAPSHGCSNARLGSQALR